jgi:hypothetical protein
MASRFKALSLPHHFDLAFLSAECTETDFDNYRRQRAWTDWKYAMLDAGLRLPAQSPDQHARCLCGAPIDIPTMAAHV